MINENTAVEFSIFGQTLTVSRGRVEYNRLRLRFRALAKEQADIARKDIEGFATHPQTLLGNGLRWAKPFFAKAAALAVEELLQKGCLDLDEEVYLESKFDYGPWEIAFKSAADDYQTVVKAEEQREAEREERTDDAGSSWAGGGFGLGGAIKGALQAEALNIASAAISEGFNKIGRNKSQKENAEKIARIFEHRKEEIVGGIFSAIANGADALVSCCNERNIPIGGAVSVEDVARAVRMCNNLKTGKIPSDRVVEAKMCILNANPYCQEFYEYVFMSEGDASGELQKVGAFFGVSFDERKKDAFLLRLGDCQYEDEERTLAYRQKAVAIAEELKYDASDKMAEIDLKLQEFDRVARTVEGRLFEDRETAVKQRELCAFESAQDLSTEELAVQAKTNVEENALLKGIDFSWRMGRINDAIKRFDEEARTADGRVFDSREIAAKQRELVEFEKSLDVSTEDSAIRSRVAFDRKVKELNVDGEWKRERIYSAVKRFERMACVAFGRAYDSREMATAAKADIDRFWEGIELVVRQGNHRSMMSGGGISEKKQNGAVQHLGVTADERLLGLIDTSLFGNVKTGMALTSIGLRWKNGSVPTTGCFIPWKEFGVLMPVANGKLIDFGEGKRFENSGLLTAPTMTVLMALQRIVGFCKEAKCL